jgi:hypothetical protein
MNTLYLFTGNAATATLTTKRSRDKVQTFLPCILSAVMYVITTD